jgi:hypothetical protein
MPDPTKRIEAWNVKTTPERTKQTLDARHAEMKRRYEVAMTALCSIEGQIKQTLNAQGVHTSLYVPYLNFGRQLWKMTRQQEISGESAAMAAQVLLEKWAARDLNAKVLAAIRTEVFDIPEPKS